MPPQMPESPHQVSDEASCKVDVLGSEQCERRPLLPGPACPADSVNMSVNVSGHIKVDYRLDGRDVQPSGCEGQEEGLDTTPRLVAVAQPTCHIGGYENGQLLLLEAGENAISLPLRHVAVKQPHWRG